MQTRPLSKTDLLLLCFGASSLRASFSVPCAGVGRVATTHHSAGQDAGKLCRHIAGTQGQTIALTIKASAA